jgi:hypothetical protein
MQILTCVEEWPLISTQQTYQNNVWIYSECWERICEVCKNLACPIVLSGMLRGLSSLVAFLTASRGEKDPPPLCCSLLDVVFGGMFMLPPESSMAEMAAKGHENCKRNVCVGMHACGCMWHTAYTLCHFGKTVSSWILLNFFDVQNVFCKEIDMHT